MTKTKKNTVNVALKNYLFNRIAQSPEYKNWISDYELPKAITDNLSRTLRDYQVEALKHFIFLFEHPDFEHLGRSGVDAARHVLFNMATGTGKTLTMAAAVLYLYLHGYRNFVFLVHQIQIKTQAEKNLTDPKFAKYLFNPKGIKINGRKVEVKSSDKFLHVSQAELGHEANHAALPPVINFVFYSTAGLYGHLTKERENGVSLDDFKKFPSVILADEAHRLNVDTRKKATKADERDLQNWESSVQAALNANHRNLLLEFTATVDLQNKSILDKYKDKLVYRYDFRRFNADRYSKIVKTLSNEETAVVDQKRRLIVNALALSEYRKLFAQSLGITLNPIVLVKSVTIKQSEEDREFFKKVVATLRPEDLAHLKKLGAQLKKDSHGHDQELALSQMFDWIERTLVTTGDSQGIQSFIKQIKADFAPAHTLIYNSQKKENAALIAELDDPRNHVRAIFSVNALNEGWDVLGLFDIIHFDISAKKRVSLQDIQLIGRGARLFPYEISDEGAEKGGLFPSNIDTDKYRRKFDRNFNMPGRILETMHYHFVKTGNFHNELQEQLLGEGIIDRGAIKRTLSLKPSFTESVTYQHGFVLLNRQVPRARTTQDEIDRVFKRSVIVRPYRLHSGALTEKQENKAIAELHRKTIKLQDPDFSEHLLRNALMRAEGNFFRFSELRRHLPELRSMDDFLRDYLPQFDVIYEYDDSMDIGLLDARQKLNILIGAVLPEIRRIIDVNLPSVMGDPVFRPVPMNKIFQPHKDIFIVGRTETDPETGDIIEHIESERALGMEEHPDENLRRNLSLEDWYAQNENFGTTEEKLFVQFIASQIDALKQRFPSSEIFLLRNELEYCVFDIQGGRRFAPDFLMFINDTKHQKLYYQCLFEAKGDHLLEHDGWKQEALLNITHASRANIPVSPVNYTTQWNGHIQEEKHAPTQEQLDAWRQEYGADWRHHVKCLGFKFFNARHEHEFERDFKATLKLSA